MKKLTTLSTAVVILSGGCATTEVPKQVQEPRKLEVTQQGMRSAVNFVSCFSDECPTHSLKVMAIPEPKTQRIVRPAVVRAKPIDQDQQQLPSKVHFGFGLSTLDDDGIRELEQAATKYGKTKGGLTLLGRTDPVGEYRFNEKLALKRAETVKKGLVANGVSVPIETRRHQPCCDGNIAASQEVHQEQRRVDIIPNTTKTKKDYDD